MLSHFPISNKYWQSNMFCRIDANNLLKDSLEDLLKRFRETIYDQYTISAACKYFQANIIAFLSNQYL